MKISEADVRASRVFADQAAPATPQ
jgi:hypothetical protein